MKVHVGKIWKGLEKQRDCALSIAGRGRLTSFSVQYKTGGVRTNRSERCHLYEDQAQDALDRPVVEKTATTQTRTANCFIGRHPGTGSTFLEAPLSSRTIRRRLAEGHLGSRNESRFNLSSDDNLVRLWRPRGERLNPASELQSHIAPTTGVMEWNCIATTPRPLVLTKGTMSSQRYVHDILLPHLLPLMQRLPRAIFQQDNARPHMAGGSQGYLHTVTTLPWPARFSNLSPIDHIWDHLRWRVGHPTSFNDLEERLQQIWNEMS
ncbi:transposable element Tcb2 transposase [Trichonephila clavipes]|nr:transposable element Tcb2 transposase [Trichonephila clavipes]